jgi:outer membrane lipoprotein carrier protein
MRLLISLLLITSLSLAQSYEELVRFLEGIRTVKVAFVQKVYYPWQSKPEVSKGIFYAERSGRFRVEYESPTRILIVSDGIKVMVYNEKDRTALLEDVEKNRSPVVESLFLFSKPVQEVFELVGELEGKGGKVFLLKPKVKDEYFSKVYVEVSVGGRVKSIKVEEKEGITTLVEFINSSYNFTPSSGLFKVEPPAGARVIKP